MPQVKMRSRSQDDRVLDCNCWMLSLGFQVLGFAFYLLTGSYITACTDFTPMTISLCLIAAFVS